MLLCWLALVVEQHEATSEAPKKWKQEQEQIERYHLGFFQSRF